MKKEKVYLDLLELRYFHIWVEHEARVRRLADTISRYGQLEVLLTRESERGQPYDSGRQLSTSSPPSNIWTRISAL